MIVQPYTIRKYAQTNRKSWEEFAEAYGTIFHERQFLHYHPASRFRDHSLMLRKKSRLLGIFPAVEHKEGSCKWLISHPGATFGSLVTHPNEGVHEISSLIKLVVGYSQKHRFTGIRITIPPVVYQCGLNNAVEFCLRREGFQYVKQELSSVLELKKLPLRDMVKPAVFRAVRKAERAGLLIRQTGDIDAFYPVLLKNLSLRHHVTPTHSLDELKRLQRLLSGKIILFGAFLQQQLVGGIMLMKTNAQTALAFYITHDMDFQHVRITDMVMIHVITWCMDAGFQYLDFGTFTQHMEPNWGLGRFKEKFGAKGVFRNTVELIL